MFLSESWDNMVNKTKNVGGDIAIRYDNYTRATSFLFLRLVCHQDQNEQNRIKFNIRTSTIIPKNILFSVSFES